MKEFSQKPTKFISEIKKETQASRTKSSANWMKRDVSIGRFAGMAKDLERVPPRYIAGYKSRG